MVFLMQHALDQYKMSVFRVEDFSTRRVVGILDICLLQKSCHGWMEGWVERNQVPAKDTQSFRDAMANKRAKIQAYPGSQQPADIAYQSNMWKSSLETLLFAHKLCYAVEFKSQFLKCVKASKSVNNVMQYPSITSGLNNVVERLEQDKTRAQETDGNKLGAGCAVAASDRSTGETTVAEKQLVLVTFLTRLICMRKSHRPRLQILSPGLSPMWGRQLGGSGQQRRLQTASLWIMKWVCTNGGIFG